MTARLALRRSRFFGPAALAALVLLAGCTALKKCAYEGFGRDGWQQPEKVVLSLAIKPGERVADLGSGGGYFTFRLSQAVGPTGKVYAVDVDKDMLEDLAERAKNDGYRNIEKVLAKYDDPSLPESGVDLIFTSNVYHHIEARAKYFADAARYLRPGGRIAIVDFNGKHWSATFVGHTTPVELIKKEMEEAGYRLESEFDFLDRQSFLVFSKKTQ
jgi:ubiquinone/menaquinone biosynthesis C-methylase UbiE